MAGEPTADDLTVEAGQRMAEYAENSDLGWVATTLAARRESILERWLVVTAAQPFHEGRRDRAVADHIPALFDALIDLLERAAPRWVEADTPLADDAVREAAEQHARMRVAQGLDPADVSLEFRLLRQEFWRALRQHLPDEAPATDTLGAQLLLNDALDGAMAVALTALTAQVDQVREEFLATTIHEVRRPLTVIRGNAGLVRRLLRRPEPNQQQIDTLLARIEATSVQMNGLLTTLIELSQAALGGFSLHATPGDLTAIFREVTAQLGPDATRVRVVVSPGCDTTGQWDVERLLQVFSNLLANALKYSPGAAPVDVAIGGDAETLSCQIADRGIGIPADELPRLFSRYMRASNATAQGIEGVGLGLYLCRALVEAHGGRVWATSPGEGQGTTIHVTLPRFPATQ